ncbi:MAG: lytic transglycosylase [Alphaproteobacteria bacterium]|jgi:hypothetical protein|nr:lytic transglycosylase [Alphaproteobacteria bacterium]
MLYRAAFGLLAATGLAALIACSRNDDPAPPEATRLAPAPIQVVARWDHLPQADRWTDAALAALDGPGAPLVDLVPADTATWCPAYPDATRAERKAFWVGLVSSLAKHESTWRPDVSGGGGRWHGLLQISPATARGYGCRATTAEALKSGPANLRCAIRIMGVTVPRDGVISQGMRGVAADWGPFHQSAKRSDMAAWTRSQSYCRG